MNCEHVRELLSSYLDNQLAFEDRQSVASHLHVCTLCSSLLADFRRFDALLSRLPRIEPRRSLEGKIFSSSEYRKLTGTWDGYYQRSRYQASSIRRLRDDPSRPKLVALPGGRLAKTVEERDVSVLPKRRQRLLAILRVVGIAIMVSILLTFGVGSIIGWHLWQRPQHHVHGSSAHVLSTRET